MMEDEFKKAEDEFDKDVLKTGLIATALIIIFSIAIVVVINKIDFKTSIIEIGREVKEIVREIEKD